MANFFKEYHAELKAKRKAESEQKAIEEREKNKHKYYELGEVVYLRPHTIWGEPQKMYYAGYFGDSTVFLTEKKKDALNGIGTAYHAYCLL